MRKLYEEDYYSIINIVITVLFCLSFVFVTSCESQSNYIDPQYNRCEEINKEFNQRVVDAAIERGWNPQSYSFNSTSIGPGFLDPYADPNFRLFLEAYNSELYEWNRQLEEANCY